MTAKPSSAGIDERRHLLIALFATLLLNVVFLVLVDRLMRPHAALRSPGARPDAVDVLLVRLIDNALPPEVEAVVDPGDTALLNSVPSALQTRRPRKADENVRASAEQAGQHVLHDAQPAPGSGGAASRAPAAAVESAPTPLRLYDPTGRLLLPDPQSANAASVRFPDRPRVAQEGNPFVHRSPLPYTPTRLDKYWPSTRETLGGELVRKATVKRAWRTPWGSQVECAWVLFFGGCGWGPEPRATAEELQQMRVEPPMPRSPVPSGEGATTQP